MRRDLLCDVSGSNVRVVRVTLAANNPSCIDDLRASVRQGLFERHSDPNAVVEVLEFLLYGLLNPRLWYGLLSVLILISVLPNNRELDSAAVLVLEVEVSSINLLLEVVVTDVDCNARGGGVSCKVPARTAA